MNIFPHSVSWVSLVGLDGFEPSTSRLSGARSNHLSYEPIQFLSVYLVSLASFVQLLSDWWRWWGSNPWPPACRAGALPAELHPHGISEEWRVKSEELRLNRFAFLHLSLIFEVFLIEWTVTQNWTTINSAFSHVPDSLVSIFDTICPWKHIRVSIERRWSSRTFRYGYLVTT